MKRIVSLILVLLTVAATLTVGVGATHNGEENIHLFQRFRQEKAFKLGDANADGYINAQDAHTIRAYIVSDGEICKDAADIEADGNVTTRDLFYLKASFVGLTNLVYYDTHNSVYKFEIGGFDISEFVIVLPEGTTYDDNLYFAYETLWKYVEKATGVTLNKVYGETDSEHAIYFNNVDINSEMGKELGNDGYIYKEADGNLYIYGTYRGNMYAVYEILEDYLGFYFCENYYTYQFQKRFVSIEKGCERKFVPPFKMRFVFHGYWGSTKPYFFLARGLIANEHKVPNALYLGGFIGSNGYVNCHSFCYFQAMGAGEMPPEGALNPDGTVMSLADRYYAKYADGIKNGVSYGKVSSQLKMDEHGPQPCASDDDEYNNIFEGMLCTIALIYAKEDSAQVLFDEGMQYMSFSINDNTDYCTCRTCIAKANGTTIYGRSESAVKNLVTNYGGDYKYKYDPSAAASKRYSITFKKEGYNGVYLDFMNRATRDLKEIYPNIRLYQIIYTPVVPESIRPMAGNIMHYCSTISSCFRHRYGDSERCNAHNLSSGTVTDVIQKVSTDEEVIPQWIQLCHENGAELWYWIYPESYTYFLFDMPNYYTLYYNIHWLYEQGIDGVSYEGTNAGGADRNFELTKSIVASELIFNPAMTLDEYIETTKKYLKVRYGPGYEHVFNYLNLWDEAGQESEYCCTYWFCLFDFFSKKAFAEKYEDMRNELLTAIAMADGDTKYYCELLFMMCEFAGLSAVYDKMYTNGTADSRKEYEARWTYWIKWMTDNNITVLATNDVASLYKLPTTVRFDASPCMQIYGREFRHTPHDCD